MELLNDISLTLKPSQNFLQGDRIVEVDLSSRLNSSQFSLQPSFNFNNEAFGFVRLDEAAESRIIISVKEDVKLASIEDELAVRYYASSQSGETVTGKIVFPNIDFDLGASPIVFELDACCSLPDKININVRDYNGGYPITLTGVGDNDTNAGTVTLTELEGSDYNDDFNGDFGMDPNQVITYTLNKATDFWKTVNARDRFTYNISYKGKTATGDIIIRLKTQ